MLVWNISSSLATAPYSTTLPYSCSPGQNCIWMLQHPTASIITLPAKESHMLRACPSSPDFYTVSLERVAWGCWSYSTPHQVLAPQTYSLFACSHEATQAPALLCQAVASTSLYVCMLTS